MKGTIKRLVFEKSFGFITPEGADKDVFFHSSELQGVQFSELQLGNTVEYTLQDTPKGPKAVGVTRV